MRLKNHVQPARRERRRGFQRCGDFPRVMRVIAVPLRAVIFADFFKAPLHARKRVQPRRDVFCGNAAKTRRAARGEGVVNMASPRDVQPYTAKIFSVFAKIKGVFFADGSDVFRRKIRSFVFYTERRVRGEIFFDFFVVGAYERGSAGRAERFESSDEFVFIAITFHMIAVDIEKYRDVGMKI